MTLMIREAREADFEAVTAITNHYITTSSIHFAYEPLSPAEVAAQWAKAKGRYPWLVATQHDRLVGHARAGVWRDRAAYQWTTEIGLYVADDCHRRGIGRRLYSELIAEVTRRGFRSAIAGITMPNDPSVALHRALGFVSVGTVREAGYKNGAWHAVEFWQKQLSSSAEPPA
jgi:phosphinothricin acetyltransferase